MKRIRSRTFCAGSIAVERRELRPVGATRQKADEPVPQVLVLAIEIIGDVLVGAVRLAQQPIGRVAEQAIGRKDEPEPRMFFRLVEPREIEKLIGVAPAPEAVEPDFEAVRDQNPARAGRIDGVVPGLLHGAAAAAGHDPIEIVRVGSFQFERSDDLVRPVRG